MITYLITFFPSFGCVVGMLPVYCSTLLTANCALKEDEKCGVVKQELLYLPPTLTAGVVKAVPKAALKHFQTFHSSVPLCIEQSAPQIPKCATNCPLNL